MKKEIKDFIPKGFEIDETRKINPSNTTTEGDYFVISIPIKKKIKLFEDYAYDYTIRRIHNLSLDNLHAWVTEFKLGLYLFICKDLDIHWSVAFDVLYEISSEDNNRIEIERVKSIIPEDFLEQLINEL